MSPRTTAVPWALAALALPGLAVAVPHLGAATLAAAELGGAVVVTAVLHRRGHLRSRVGGGIVAVLSTLAVSSTLLVAVGPGNPASMALVVLSQVVGLAGLAPVVARYRRSPGRLEHRGWVGAEVGIVVVGTGVLVLQATVGVHRAGRAGQATDVATLAAGADVVGLAVVLWLALTRTGLAVAARLLLAASALLLLQNLLATTNGVPLGSVAEPGQAIGVLAALLFAAAGTRRSVPDVGDRRCSPGLRSGATRLFVVLPYSLAPAMTWAIGVLDPASALPPQVLIGATLMVTVLALVRALGLVADAERAADTDALTGRLGRRGVLRRLDALHAARRPAWVVLVNLDDFTGVNERHGQEAGDALLRAALDRLAARLPAALAVARLGGDELLIVVAADSTSAEVAAGVVSAAVSESFTVDGVPVTVTASVGVVALDAPTSTDALHHADLAVRAAKARGGDRWLCYAPELHDEVLGPQLMQRELRALVAGDGERTGSADGAGCLVVHYQPLVDLATGAPDGVEALVRWQHPERGLVRPDVFLPLAETAGVGAALDREVMRQALHQVAAWDALGLAVPHVGVNLGRHSMREPGLRGHVLAACAAAGVGPGRLVLEITEHDELAPDAGVVDDLLALREAGVGVALDDFGAGHASVGYLRRWPANVVKLDRSLLPSVAPVPAHPAMLDPGDLIVAVGSLVHALRRALLVEGIEDEDDLAVALAAGAHLGQGYHFARPMPPDGVSTWWRERTAALRAEAVPAVPRSR